MAPPVGWLATGVAALVSLSACVAPQAPPTRTPTAAARADMPQVARAPIPEEHRRDFDQLANCVSGPETIDTGVSRRSSTRAVEAIARL